MSLRSAKINQVEVYGLFGLVLLDVNRPSTGFFSLDRAVKPLIWRSHMSEAVIESNVEPTEWFGGHRTCLWGCVTVSLIFIGLRIYQGEFALTYGIDSASPEFTQYWMGLTALQLASVGIFCGLWFGWLVASGRRTLPR